MQRNNESIGDFYTRKHEHKHNFTLGVAQFLDTNSTSDSKDIYIDPPHN